MRRRQLLLSVLSIGGAVACPPDPTPPPYWPDHVARSFRFLFSSQNADGSWGAGGLQIYETSLGVLACFHHGMSPNKYGWMEVERGLAWLLNQAKPQMAADIAMRSHTFDFAYNLTRIPLLREPLQRDQTLVSANEAPEWTKLWVELPRSSLDTQPPLPMADFKMKLAMLLSSEGLPGGIRYYLQGLSHFLHHECDRMEFKRTWVTELVRKQKPNGAFALDDCSTDAESAAVGLMTTAHSMDSFKAWQLLNLVPPPNTLEMKSITYQGPKTQDDY